MKTTEHDSIFDICIVGGCGHVGLPLGIAFADRNKRVVLYDINLQSIAKVNNGVVPFREEGAKEVLSRVIKNKNLIATDDPKVISQSKTVVLVIGTPVDEHLNPKTGEIMRAIDEIADYLGDEQLLVMRSTLYPGMTEKVQKYLKNKITTRDGRKGVANRIVDGQKS